jgi:hypothetical protein
MTDAPVSVDLRAFSDRLSAWLRLGPLPEEIEATAHDLIVRHGYGPMTRPSTFLRLRDLSVLRRTTNCTGLQPVRSKSHSKPRGEACGQDELITPPLTDCRKLIRAHYIRLRGTVNIRASIWPVGQA